MAGGMFSGAWAGMQRLSAQEVDCQRSRTCTLGEGTRQRFLERASGEGRGVILVVTARKFEFFLMSVCPVPARRKPVTVSCENIKGCIRASADSFV